MRLFLFVLLTLWTSIGMAKNPSDLRVYGQTAPTTLYLFTSPSCQHCAIFHKTIFSDLIKKYANKNRAQILIVDMPSDKTTLNAVMLLRCLPEDKATRFQTWLYQNQAKWVGSPNAIDQFQHYTQTIGMTTSDFKQCLNNSDLKDDIIDQRNNLSSLYKVAGTPTIAMRQGNSVKLYTGTNRHAILVGLDADIQASKNR